MQRLYLLLIFLLLFSLLNGCTGHDPAWRHKAQLSLLQLQQDGAALSHPAALADVEQTIKRGEELLKEFAEVRADEQFKLAYQKGLILSEEIALEKEKELMAARLKALEEQIQREEDERLKREKQRRIAYEELVSKKMESLKQEQARARQEMQPAPSPVTLYTVKRGETLPQIAAKQEIYGDTNLWPLIYRANRDQIRDPHQLWPGQVLKVPRNFTKEDALEARRQAYKPVK